jgi:hypothetical protein
MARNPDKTDKKLPAIPLHIYGIWNSLTNKILKISLDHTEISLDLDLDNSNDELELVEFDVNIEFDD